MFWQVLGVVASVGCTRNRATPCHSAPQGPSGSIAAGSVPRTHRLAGAAQSSQPWPVPSSAPTASVCPAATAGRRWSAAVCESDACRLRPARCHGARAGIPGDCHSQPGPVTAARATGSLVRQLRCDAGRWLPCRCAREWSTYRYVEPDWLSPGGPTLSQRNSPGLGR
jgi:hypothetical protein